MAQDKPKGSGPFVLYISNVPDRERTTVMLITDRIHKPINPRMLGIRIEGVADGKTVLVAVYFTPEDRAKAQESLEGMMIYGHPIHLHPVDGPNPNFPFPIDTSNQAFIFQGGVILPASERRRLPPEWRRHR